MHRGDLTIVMTASSVTHFELSGSGKLAIQGYKHDNLSVDLAGNADVSANGETQTLALSISGSGDSDLTGLKLSDANVDIQGSGEATLAPTGKAAINISGSGDVTLLSRPSKLESNVSGSGAIHQKDSQVDHKSEPPSSRAKRART